MNIREKNNEDAYYAQVLRRIERHSTQQRYIYICV